MTIGRNNGLVVAAVYRIRRFAISRIRRPVIGLDPGFGTQLS